MPKNVMCKKCNNLINGWCEKKIDSPDPNMVRDCQYFWEKTNADRIRAMSDDLLATQLVQVVKETIKALTEIDLPDEIANEIRSNFLVKLKQPAE